MDSFGDEGTAGRTFPWEFAFFAGFAILITMAVNLAGVLAVFAFLIIPAFSASLIANGFGKRLVVGWGLGTAGSFAGLVCAYVADLPVGATVVSVLGMVPIIAGAIRFLGGRARA